MAKLFVSVCASSNFFNIARHMIKILDALVAVTHRDHIIYVFFFSFKEAYKLIFELYND